MSEKVESRAVETLATLLLRAADFVREVQQFSCVRSQEEGDKPFNVCDYSAMEDSERALRGAAVGAAPPPAAPELARYERDLAHLATLAPNWDSYGGVPITAEAIAAVRSFMHRVQVCPRSNGGLQLELAAASGDALNELAFEPDGSVEQDEERGAGALPREPSQAAVEAADIVARKWHGDEERYTYNITRLILQAAYAIDGLARGAGEAVPAPDEPNEIIHINEAGQVVTPTEKLLRESIAAAMRELGAPQPDYPAPVVTAIEILAVALNRSAAVGPRAPEEPRKTPEQEITEAGFRIKRFSIADVERDPERFEILPNGEIAVRAVRGPRPAEGSPE